jgi:hypothetical protein
MLFNKLFRTPKNQVSTPRPECGVGFDSSARAMNRDTKENVSLVSFERKQMLNTLKRKIALVAVSAVGLSGLALMSAPAANAAVTALTSMTNDPKRNVSLAGNGLGVSSYTATNAAKATFGNSQNSVTVNLVGTTDTTQANNIVVGETVLVRAVVVTAPTAATIDSTTAIAIGDTLAGVGYLKNNTASAITIATAGESINAVTVGGSLLDAVNKRAFRTAGTYTVDVWVDATTSTQALDPTIFSGDGQAIGEPVLRATITIGGVPTQMALSATSGTAAGTSPGAVSLTLKDANGIPTLLQTFRNESITVRTTLPAVTVAAETITIRRGTALAFNSGLTETVTSQSRVVGVGANTASVAALPAGQSMVVVGNNESITATTGAYNYRINHSGAMASIVGFNFAQTTGGLTALAAELTYSFSTVAGALVSKVKVTNSSGVHEESTTATGASTNNFQVFTAPTSLDTATLASYKVNPGTTTVGVQITGTAAAVVNVTVTASTTAGVTVGTTQATLDAAGVATVNFTATTASGTYTVSIPTAAPLAGIGSATVLTFLYETAGNTVAALGKNGISTDLLSATVTSTVVKVGATTAIKVTVKDQYGTLIPYYSVKGVLSATSRNVANVFATAYTGADGTATVSLTDVSTSTTNMTDVLTINVASPGTAVTDSLITGNVFTITYSATGTYASLTLTGGTTATVTQTRQIESVTGSAVALVEVGITPSLKDSAALAVTGVGITYTGSDGVLFRATSGTRATAGDVKTITKGSTTQIFAYATKPGVATITATGGGLTATTTFTVTEAIAGTARILSAASAAGRVTATVKDGWGNPVAGITVSFASDNKGIFGNGTSSTSALTDATGLASAIVQSADGTVADVSVISTISGGQSASIAEADVKDFAAGVKAVTTVAKTAAATASTDTAITAVKADVATANSAVKGLATQVTVLQASVATLIDSLTTQIASLMQSVSALTKAVNKLKKKK